MLGIFFFFKKTYSYYFYFTIFHVFKTDNCDKRVKILYSVLFIHNLVLGCFEVFISTVLQYFITMMIFLWPGFGSKAFEFLWSTIVNNVSYLCNSCLSPLSIFTLHSICASFTITIILILYLAEILQCFWSNDGSPHLYFLFLFSISSKFWHWNGGVIEFISQSQGEIHIIFLILAYFVSLSTGPFFLLFWVIRR